MLSPPDPLLFTRGRPLDPRLGDVTMVGSSKDVTKDHQNLFSLVIHGCPDDLGVTRNRGRAGASEGPDGIRQAFYKFALPQNQNFGKKMRLYDAGNIVVSKDILVTHQNAKAAAEDSAKIGATTIALGGGHDFAAPNILGWVRGRRVFKTPKRVFGVINVDPHLDVRELEENLPHSGTPFRQILESKEVHGKHLVQFGARDGRNAAVHFEFCKKHKVVIKEFDALKSKGTLTKSFQTSLSTLAKQCSDIALTIDIDSCCEVEGASAAAVIGFSTWELCQFAFHAGSHKKVSYLEIAEVAPKLDPTGRASRIAAEILFYFLKGRAQLAG